MVYKTTIYRLLARHEWREVMLLPRHVEANPQEQETIALAYISSDVRAVRVSHASSVPAIMIVSGLVAG